MSRFFAIFSEIALMLQECLESKCTGKSKKMQLDVGNEPYLSRQQYK